MMIPNCYLVRIGLGVMLLTLNVWAQNPLIRDQFTADPTARVFEGKLYVYPSHDIPVPPDSGARENWFCMEDYHVFSSEDLMEWTDHGVIVTQTEVPWLERKQYNMWAPDCVARDGKYYFYFPTGRRIGVAVADKPFGPFECEAQPVDGARGIDPCVLVDKDGQAYLYTSMNRIFVGKLKDNMRELDSEMTVIENLPQNGLIEGPFVFERNGLYYLTYPHVHNKTERLEYAIGDNPMGPFKHQGVIMDESASGCWTNHHSIVQYQGQWVLFYHDQDLSPDFDKNRSIRADVLTFNEDGTIEKVIPTLRGVGITDARQEIQIDRYSAISHLGTSVAFLNDDNTFEGWKSVLTGKYAWIRYNKVDFGDQVKNIKIKARSITGGNVVVRLDSEQKDTLAQVEIPSNVDWKVFSAKLAQSPAEVQDMVIAWSGAGSVEIDWVQFE